MHKITLQLTKTTTGTFRFDNDDESSHLRTIYVRKSAFIEGREPTHVTITIEGPEVFDSTPKPAAKPTLRRKAKAA